MAAGGPASPAVAVRLVLGGNVGGCWARRSAGPHHELRASWSLSELPVALRVAPCGSGRATNVVCAVPRVTRISQPWCVRGLPAAAGLVLSVLRPGSGLLTVSSAGRGPGPLRSALWRSFRRRSTPSRTQIGPAPARADPASGTRRLGVFARRGGAAAATACLTPCFQTPAGPGGMHGLAVQSGDLASLVQGVLEG